MYYHLVRLCPLSGHVKSRSLQEQAFVELRSLKRIDHVKKDLTLGYAHENITRLVVSVR